MFLTFPLSIIRSFSLYTQQRYMSYRFVDSLRAGSGWNKPISPRRLREGGAAILRALNKNHNIAILGIKLIKPLLIKKLRLQNTPKKY